MRSVQITERTKSPRRWWCCLIISKLNIFAPKWKYLRCPGKVTFGLLDKLYLILPPSTCHLWRLWKSSCEKISIISRNRFFPVPSPTLTKSATWKLASCPLSETTFTKGLEHLFSSSRSLLRAVSKLCSVWPWPWARESPTTADLHQAPTGRWTGAVAPSHTHTHTHSEPRNSRAKISPRPGDRSIGRRIEDRRGRRENILEDQLWRSSLGLSPKCLKDREGSRTFWIAAWWQLPRNIRRLLESVTPSLSTHADPLVGLPSVRLSPLHSAKPCLTPQKLLYILSENLPTWILINMGRFPCFRP